MRLMLAAMLFATLGFSSFADAGDAMAEMKITALPEPVILPEKLTGNAKRLADKAMKDTRAYDLVASLTTEVGPRSAGSAGDRAAVAWALANLKRLGFRNVRAEPVEVPHWERGEISASIVSPYPQEMFAIALGGSIGTPAEGITAPIIAVESLDALGKLSEKQVRGKIVYISEKMNRARDGSGYGPAVAKRGSGASEAAKLGAVALVIRSVGTDYDRNPHTGAMRYQENVKRIPAIAISNPDADLLDRQVASGKPVTFTFTLSSRTLPNEMSANVIGEIPGKTDEVVLLGAHLDSWDVGTGAQDDGAGVAIVTMAAKLIDELKEKPLRTIRVVLYANEEFGLSGGNAYRDAYLGQADKHVLAMEADFGAGRVWKLESKVPDTHLGEVAAIFETVKPLDIQWAGNDGYGGADIGPMIRQGVPTIEPGQDGTLYFDLHHTENDTLDKIDPEQLAQNVAVYSMIAYLAANKENTFGRLPKPIMN